MKKIYLVLLLFVSHFSFAQIAINPDAVYVDGVTADMFEGVGYADVTNGYGEELNLTWQRTIIEMTEGWTVAVCDLVQCYLTHVSTQSFDIPAGGSGDMDVHAYPNDVDGSAIIQVDVFKTDDPDNTDYHASAIYYFNQLSGVAERLNEAITVFPNPTVNFFEIGAPEKVALVDIYSVDGKLVRRVKTAGNSRVDVSDLNSGNYILRLMDAEENIVSSNILSKN